MEDFEKYLDLPCEKITKEKLEDIVSSNDDFRAYAMLFEIYGDMLTREEYLDLRERYLRLFDTNLQPLPECCKELDVKWNVI
ncbi:MAG: hypothetical protein IKB72_03450 [Ruminococcus sp.]|nr:hypothetical protein [Ruminococcus sp.]